MDLLLPRPPQWRQEKQRGRAGSSARGVGEPGGMKLKWPQEAKEGWPPAWVGGASSAGSGESSHQAKGWRQQHQHNFCTPTACPPPNPGHLHHPWEQMSLQSANSLTGPPRSSPIWGTMAWPPCTGLATCLSPACAPRAEAAGRGSALRGGPKQLLLWGREAVTGPQAQA